MAWNRNAENAAQPTPKKKPSVLRGVIAGAVTLAVSAVVVFFVLSGKEKMPKVKFEKKPTAINEAKPGVVVTNQMSKIATDALAEVASVATNVPTPKGTNGVDFASMTADEAAKHGYYKSIERFVGAHARVFKTRSEEMTAGLLCTTPGRMVVNVALPRNFDDEILASIISKPLLPEEGDDDYTRERKEAMLDAREAFKKGIAEGKKPSELFEETRSEMRRLYEMRKNIQDAVTEKRKSGASQAEIYECIEAGNRLLDKYNVKRLLTPLALKNKESTTKGCDK